MRCKKCNGRILQSNPQRCQHCGTLLVDENQSRNKVVASSYNAPKEIKKTIQNSVNQDKEIDLRVRLIGIGVLFLIVGSLLVVFSVFSNDYSQTITSYSQGRYEPPRYGYGYGFIPGVGLNSMASPYLIPGTGQYYGGGYSSTKVYPLAYLSNGSLIVGIVSLVVGLIAFLALITRFHKKTY
jgi:hypothetical protein